MSAIASLRAACTHVANVFEREVNEQTGLIITVTRESYDKMAEKIAAESSGARAYVRVADGWFMLDGFKFVRAT